MKITVRTKPVLLEAEQWFPEHEILGVKTVIRDNGSVIGVVPGLWGGEAHLHPGDWIIRHPDGAQVVVSAKFFSETYEIVTE